MREQVNWCPMLSNEWSVIDDIVPSQAGCILLVFSVRQGYAWGTPQIRWYSSSIEQWTCTILGMNQNVDSSCLLSWAGLCMRDSSNITHKMVQLRCQTVNLYHLVGWIRMWTWSGKPCDQLSEITHKLQFTVCAGAVGYLQELVTWLVTSSLHIHVLIHCIQVYTGYRFAVWHQSCTILWVIFEVSLVHNPV